MTQLTSAQFQLPNAYAELTASISRWHRWLDLVDPAAGGELLPADTSEGERTALQRLATALMYFSAARAASPSDEHEEDFLTGLQRTSRLEEFAAASRHADVVLDWVGEEFVVCTSSSVQTPPSVGLLVSGVSGLVPFLAGL